MVEPLIHPQPQGAHPGAPEPVHETLAVLFADLSGSTALYQAWGNVRATDAVTGLTQWIGEVVQAHGGRVVKKLGDGVLGVFARAEQAVAAAGALQRQQHGGHERSPSGMPLGVRVGVASGEVVQVDGDTYGDAVNVAARLCERADTGEIWVTDTTAVDAGAVPRIQFRKLGVFELRGKTGNQPVYLADWREGETVESLTEAGGLPSALAPMPASEGAIALSLCGGRRLFSSSEVPLHLGRAHSVQLCIDDPRVSRMHARIDWRGGSFVLTDLSSFGTWVRFDGSGSEVALRREACLLHGAGQIALGMPFGAQAPVLDFQVSPEYGFLVD